MNELIDRYLEGSVILIDKPLSWTSFDAVNYVRNFFRKAMGVPKIKIGHAGTLDPLATGLLILCTGKATKRIQEFQDLPKTYTCTINFSGITPSYDLETAIKEESHWHRINGDLINEALSEFRGEIQQVPPGFSAIKIAGQRAYEHARKAKEPKLEPRLVNIHRFDMLALNLPEAEFLVECSKGTYIRSLARDLGRALGAGAYLSALRRTHIGDLSVEDAFSPEEFCRNLRSQL